MDRPRSIRLFELFWWVGASFWAVAQWFAWDGLQASLARRFGAAAARDPGVAVVAANAQWAVLATVAVATVLLWWLVARRRSIIARWLVAAAGASSLAQGALAAVRLVTEFGLGPLAGLASAIAFASTVVAALMLFCEDARGWFGESDATPGEEAAA